VLLDETGFRLQPVRRRTWALRGQTPVQRAWDRHDRLSVIGAITVSPQRRRLGLAFRVHHENICAPHVTQFLTQLRYQLRRPILVVLDRLPAHRSAARRLAAMGRHDIALEWLPAYAPDLNPVEAHWSYTKYSDLANYLPADATQLRRAVYQSLRRQSTQQHLLHSFFETAKLNL